MAKTARWQADPQPKPKTSNSNVKTMTFWYDPAGVHQSPYALQPRPVRVQRDDRGAGGDIAILVRWAGTAYGVPKPCSTQSRVTTCNRVRRGWGSQVS